MSLAARRQCTGESWQALTVAGATPEVPRAEQDEQAWLETELLLARTGPGGLTVHPLGIVRVKPEPRALILQLACEPFVVRHWAELTVPWFDGSMDDPCDAISGVAGMRWRCHGQGVDLTRPGTGALVRLTGFPARWWERAVAARVRACPNANGRLVSDADWTPVERAADTGWKSLRGHAPHIGSAILRRIRATAGPGPANSTTVWCDVIGDYSDWVVETTDGPPCGSVIPLLTAGPAGAGWELDSHSCHCGDDAEAACVAVLRASDCQEVWYRNLHWTRTEGWPDKSDAVAVRNAAAFHDE